MQKKPSRTTSQRKKEELIEALPDKVLLFGKEITVVVTNLKGLHGDYDSTKQIIRIHQSQDIDEARRTLFHELIHAALAISGHNQMLPENHEEALVRMLEQALYSLVDISKLALDK